jgi:acetyl-CoA acetyltransferase
MPAASTTAPARCSWPTSEAAKLRPDAARPRGRHGHRRRAAARDGHRPGAGHRRRCWSSAGLSLDQIDVIELNEAFAAQAWRCLRELGLKDDDARVNPNGGAIALGHPLGMSGTRLALTAALGLAREGKGRALCTMCIGVGQGIALALEAA